MKVTIEFPMESKKKGADPTGEVENPNHTGY